MDIQTCLTNFKLISSTQVDLSYFNNIAPMVFKDPSVYAAIQSDVQFINQIGSTIYNYFNQKDPESQKIWIAALKTGLSTAIVDANGLIALIPEGVPAGADLKIVLQEFIADCQAIQAILPESEVKLRK